MPARVCASRPLGLHSVPLGDDLDSASIFIRSSRACIPRSASSTLRFKMHIGDDGRAVECYDGYMFISTHKASPRGLHYIPLVPCIPVRLQFSLLATSTPSLYIHDLT